MMISRYPNEGYLSVGEVTNNQSNNYSFIFEDDRIKSWKNINDIWMFGYWYYNWKDDYLKINSIDFSTNEIKMRPMELKKINDFSLLIY